MVWCGKGFIYLEPIFFWLISGFNTWILCVCVSDLYVRMYNIYIYIMSATKHTVSYGIGAMVIHSILVWVQFQL